MRVRPLVICFVATVWGVAASASVIQYSVSRVAGDEWRYEYAVTNTNDSPDTALQEFTIFFDVGLYADLHSASAPADWDPFIGVIDPNLPDAGFVDFLALGNGVAANAP